jgi:anti-sigma factor RsiW
VAATVLLMVGTVAGGFWYWQGRVDETVWTRFGSEALAAHLALATSKSQPRVSASLQDVAQIFSAKLNAPFRLRVPADPNFTLVGSRLLPGGIGPVAQLAFRGASGTLITMYFEPWPRKRDVPFRPLASESNVRSLGWIEDELGCAITGTLPQDQLESVGRALYAALLKG